eukprot:gene10684-22294_t
MSAIEARLNDEIAPDFEGIFSEKKSRRATHYYYRKNPWHIYIITNKKLSHLCKSRGIMTRNSRQSHSSPT